MAQPQIVGKPQVTTQSRGGAVAPGKSSVRTHQGAQNKPANTSNISHIAANRGHKVALRRNRDADADDISQSEQAHEKRPRSLPQSKKRMGIRAKGNFVKKNAKRIRAGSVGLGIAAILSWIYIIQIAFFVLFITTFYYADSVGFMGQYIPSELLLILTWIIIMLIGLGSMAYAAMAFSTAGVAWLGMNKDLMFGLFCILYICPFVFVVPWVFIWIFVVTYYQK
ncbi:MAG: hypothetical protein ACI92I_000280 [Acidimicrobiales bacterium]|jgi:hypothetical protein